jgi:maspardin
MTRFRNYQPNGLPRSSLQLEFDMKLEEFRRLHPRNQIEIAGQIWTYIESGDPADGTTLVMLPGAQGNEENFFKVMLELEDTARVIAVNYPDEPDTVQLVDGLEGVLAALSISRCHLLGTSFAGNWLQHFAATHPERIACLYIANSFHGPAASPDAAAEVAAQDAEAMKAAQLERVKGYPEDTPEKTEFKTIMLDLFGACQSAENFKARRLGVSKATQPPSLMLENSQIVIIDCDDDPVIKPELRDGVPAAYPGASRHSLERGGHFPFLTQPQAYASILRLHLGN